MNALRVAAEQPIGKLGNLARHSTGVAASVRSYRIGQG